MNKNTSGFLYLIFTVIFFSTYEVVSRSLVGKIDPFQINFVRFFIGGIILFCVTLFKRDFKISRKDFTGVLLLGITNVVISMSLLQISLYMPGAKASVNAVIFSSNPIFVTAFAAIIHKEKVSIYKLIGLLIGVLGIAVIFMDKLGIDKNAIISMLLALLSAIFFGLYTVIGRGVSTKIGSLKMNCYSFILGSIGLIPFMFIGRFFDFIPESTSYRLDYLAVIQIAYLSIFVTGIAYITYFRGLSLVGASTGSLVFFVKPVLASFIAVIFLKEGITSNLIIGTLMVVAGIIVIVYWPHISPKILKGKSA